MCVCADILHVVGKLSSEADADEAEVSQLDEAEGKREKM